MHEHESHIDESTGEKYWNWTFTDWSRRILVATSASSVGSSIALGFSIVENNPNGIVYSVGSLMFLVPATTLIAAKERIESSYRKKHNISRPLKSDLNS